ncbi:helix-turn-helix domain-containing protein [Embleya sp. MST-111070]|uniref:helix-turn-helix domain-containing protein n=1 Tax=Embleya sp. MST-111070 TaxID=3398231 RepID=UPI003F73B64A
MKLGVLIRDLRMARGWSQAALRDNLNRVAGTNITREYVSRWESGKRSPGPFWCRHLATVLQVPVAALEGGDVDRRRFLTNGAASAIAPLVASDLLAHGFAAAIGGRRPDVDGWEDRLTTYGRDYMSLGAADIQVRLTSDLAIVQQQLERPELWSVAARMMTLFGKTFPGSDGAKAAEWYRYASEAADRSGDEATRVWVRARAAIALGYEGASLGLADMFADQALAISDRPTLARLNALMGKAHVMALRGDKASALHLLSEGRRVFDVVASDDPESDYAVPWWRFNVLVSLLLARLGEEQSALVAQEAASRSLPATLPRFVTHLEMHQGLMLARTGDRVGGITHARTALERLPVAKHSLTLRMLMNEIQSPPHGT